MADSVFDPQTFLEAEQTGDFNTTSTPFPEAICFANIKYMNFESGTGKDGRDWFAVDFTFQTDDEEVKRISGLQNPRVRMPRIFLAMTGEGEQRHITTDQEDVNANIALGRLREAVGMKKGKPWRFADFQDAGCWIKTQHSPNPRALEDPFAPKVLCNVVVVSRERIRG